MKKLMLLLLCAGSLLAGDPYDYKKTVQRRVAPAAITHPIEGRSLVDFGQEAFGFLEFTPPKGARGAYEVRLGELTKPDGSVNMHPGATIRAARIVGEITRDGVHRVPLVADRRNTNGGKEGAAIKIPAEHGVVMPFRYAEVFKAPFAVSPDTVRMVAVEYPMDMNASSFTCDDPRLVKIYNLCKQSIRATSFAGIYVDGDRERIPYEADAYLNQLGEYAVHADYSLGRASHEYLMAHPTWPTEWKQHSIKMAWTDWMWTGDPRSLAKCYDQLKNDKLLERFRRQSDGLLVTGNAANKFSKANPKGARDIVDWPVAERDGYVFEDLNAVVNAFYYRNLLEMADIAKALGRQGDADAFAARAKNVYAAYQRVFFRPKAGVYADGEKTEHASLHANAAALAFGLVPKERQARVVEHLESRGMACSVYFAQYLLEAFFEAGRADLALKLITAPGDRGWLHMSELGATITLEAWDVKYKPNLDLNHAWGTPPINVISRCLLGVTPLEPGFAKVRIAPQFGRLREVRGKVPTAKGPVLVNLAKGAIEITTPVPAQVVVAGRAQEVPAGTHRFAAPEPAGMGPVRRLVLSDESRGRIHYYDSADPSKCFWVDAEKTTWDIQPVGERAPGKLGRYRYMCRNGFKVVDLDTRRHVDEFRHPSLAGICSASDLPDGGFIAGVNQGRKILVRRFSRDRKLVCTYTFNGIHNCRTMQRLENGDLVFAHETGYTHARLPNVDHDAPGIFVRTGKMPHSRNMYHAVPTLDGKGYWTGAGYAAEVVRFDINGKPEKIWSAPAKDGLKGYFFGEVKETADGHVLVSNWTGHGPNDSRRGWQLIEFDAEGKVAWTLHNPEVYGSVHGYVALEAPHLPLIDKAVSWEANPISWKFDRVARTLRTTLGTSFAVADTTRAAETEFRVRVTPERAGTNGWATLGLSLHDSDRDFWHVALVRTPPESGEKHWFELCEMRNGLWLSQNEDHLQCTERKTDGTWEYGKTYELTLKTTPAGIRGEVKDEQGKSLFVCAYAFPKAADDGMVKAVANGRFALHTTGSFQGTFKDASAAAKDACPTPVPSQPLEYSSDSFVPGVTDRATGFFHTAQKDGRWWVIDPKGRGMVLLGVDHVTYWGHRSQRTNKAHYLDAMKAKFPNKRDWEEDTLARLKRWGFNFLGAGCDPMLKRRGLAHTVFLSIGDGLCWNPDQPDYYICPNEHRPCSAFPNVFHPDFARWADFCARRSCAPNRDDPWLFGYFIDNELAWWGRGRGDTGLFDAVAKLPDTHSARIAQRRFLAERGIKDGKVSDAVKLDFLRLAADIYFRVSSEAIRRYDPNHLVMGARFAGLGGAHPVVWEASGKYCDVVTFNCYPWADLDRNVMLMHRGGGRVDEAFTKQYEHVKKPMLVTEWSFPALDSGLPCTGGAGQRFMTQTQRTQATELFAKTMLALPFLVGYDYFMWVDEPPEGISDAFPEDSNYGLINERGEAYPEITAMFAKLHRGLGEVRAAGVPAEKPSSAKREGVTADEFLAKLRTGEGVKCARDGDRYTIRTAAGLELAGQVGGHFVFDSVLLNGKPLGQYNCMLSNEDAGSRQWHEAAKVVAAEWRDHALVVTSEGWYGEKGHFALTQKLTPVADKPWFLCELVEAKNLGSTPIEGTFFYFRQYSPFGPEKAKSGFKHVPNLWNTPMYDAWFSTDGRYFGGASFAKDATFFVYHLMDGGKSQHPDAQFAPPQPLTLRPGEVFRPQGTMWMLAIGGLDGIGNWKKLTREFLSAKIR